MAAVSAIACLLLTAARASTTTCETPASGGSLVLLQQKAEMTTQSSRENLLVDGAEAPLTEKDLQGGPGDEAKNLWRQSHFKTITCPVLGSLFKNGDLEPDDDGMIGRQQTLDALLRIGISSAVANGATGANFDHLVEPKQIHLFGMDLNRDVALDPTMVSKEHDFSTGIRDGSEPNIDKYKEFEQFIDTDGDKSAWSQTDVDAAITHFEENSNDFGENQNGLSTIKTMLREFGENETLTRGDMKRLFVYSTYPPAFLVKRQQAIADFDAQQASTR